jgi:EAL and modified HD-GYP domain-containing signal transduction protein
MDVYVARQPIFRRDKRLYAYELLFRDNLTNIFPDIDGDSATSKLLFNSFLTIGMEKICGRKKAFINFTEDMLVKRVPLMFSKDKIVVEILEDVEPEVEVINACREIAEKGYVLAMDDFYYKSELEPLISLANLIKIDFRSTSSQEIEEYVKKLSEYDVYLLAEKIETYEEFAEALEMGFHYFQGYFFSKPEIIKGRDISASELNILNIMAEANKEELEIQTLEKLIAMDLTISYKLFRYINSTYFKRASEISSIKQAIVLLGEMRLRRFLSLIAMSNLSPGKPDELLRKSIIRARFCELVGEMTSTGVSPSELFVLGLFSLIDAIMDDSMENLMKKLPLSKNIKDVLLYNNGELKDYLNLAVCYETGDWERMPEATAALGINEEELPQCYMDALSWADSLT